MSIICGGLITQLNAETDYSIKPFLTKSSHTGYTPQEWAYSSTCEFYKDHVVITKHFGGHENNFVHVEKRPYKIERNLEGVLKKASEEKLEIGPVAPCDGPSTEVRLGHVEGDRGVLFSTGACGGTQMSKKGAFSHHLREFAKIYCPQTHSF